MMTGSLRVCVAASTLQSIPKHPSSSQDEFVFQPPKMLMYRVYSRIVITRKSHCVRGRFLLENANAI